MKSLLLIVSLGMAGLPGCSLNPPPQTGFDCNAPAPAGKLVKVKDAIAGKYIVVLAPPSGALGAAIEAKASIETFAKQFVGVSEVRTLARGFSAQVDTLSLKALLASPRVERVFEVGVKSISPLAAPKAETPTGIDRANQVSLPLDGNADFGPKRGAGLHFISIDTGVDCGHPEFGGRCGEGHSAIGGTPDDTQGHGTHTTSTAVGKNFGVANLATIHSCRFLDAQGSGDDAGAVDCIQWATDLCVRNGWQCVVNNSWGGTAAESIDRVMCDSIKAGVFHANAAGNSNLNACNDSPSRVLQATVSGAVDPRTDYVASFSNDGPCLSCYAGGVDILGAAPGGGSATYSGTSMASPTTAGVAILCAERIGPGATPAAIKQCVLDNATPGKVGGIPSDSPNLMLHYEGR